MCFPGHGVVTAIRRPKASLFSLLAIGLYMGWPRNVCASAVLRHLDVVGKAVLQLVLAAQIGLGRASLVMLLRYFSSLML